MFKNSLNNNPLKIIDQWILNNEEGFDLQVPGGFLSLRFCSKVGIVFSLHQVWSDKVQNNIVLLNVFPFTMLH